MHVGTILLINKIVHTTMETYYFVIHKYSWHDNLKKKHAKMNFFVIFEIRRFGKMTVFQTSNLNGISQN